MLVIYELIDLFPENFSPHFAPRLKQLFQLLQREKKLSRTEAAEKLLGADANMHYFNKLRVKLKQRLVDYLMIQPPAWANNKEKVLCDRVYKEFTSYKILLAGGQRSAAIALAESLILHAKRLELYEILYMIYTDLEYHYSVINLNLKKSKFHRKKINHYLSLITTECKIRYFYSKINQIYNVRNSYSSADKKSFKEAIKEVYAFRKLNSSKLNRLIYNILIMKYYTEYDYPKILSTCNEALQSFDPAHPNINAFRFAFLQKKIPAFIVLRHYKEAKSIAKEVSGLVPKGKFNWHLILIQRIEICFHSGAFQEAYDLYKAHKQTTTTYPVLMEYWEIIRSILYFLIQVGHVQSYTTERFNLGKFLNETPIYAKDKAGININILIVQILIEMQREQFGRIIDRIEALQAYSRNHTRKAETARAYIFIQMIIMMEKASFHRAATERKTEKLFDKLKKTPLRLRQNLAVEIIPYEFLWTKILAMLENKFRATKMNKKKSKDNISKK